MTEPPHAHPMRHAPSYPPPPQQYYPYSMPPQPPPPQPRDEQTPPRATGSFNNDDSPSGHAVDTLLKAAALADGGAMGENTEPQVSTNASAIHGFGPSPTKEIAPVNHDSGTSNSPEEAASTKESEPQQNQVEPASESKNDTASQPMTEPIDTSAPPIEERLSAEVSPDHSDKNSRKRPYSTTEEEEAPSSFNPPSRPSNVKEHKVELFRNPTANEAEDEKIPRPERNVSADSDDAHGRVKEPPAKKTAMKPNQS